MGDQVCVVGDILGDEGMFVCIVGIVECIFFFCCSVDDIDQVECVIVVNVDQMFVVVVVVDLELCV